MTDSLPLLRLKKNEDRRLRAGHLWIFSNEVDVAATPLKNFAAGDIARVVSDREHFLGYAYINPNALICARIVSRNAERRVDRALIVERLRRALALRERLHSTSHYRWVFGESDGLPGLILDRYDDVIVGQIATAGMEALRAVVESAVREVVKPAALVWKNDGGSRELEHLPAYLEAAWGEVRDEVPDEVKIIEGDAPFIAPLKHGQKTGWFYDQAANRAQLVRLLPPGARVLDVCSYVGAWGVAAARAGASGVTCVDASETALDYVRRNAAANSVTIDTIKGDAFDVLADLAARNERYDAVILDPPAFAKRRKDVPKAASAYRKLNQLALRLIPDGLLVSCSCSWHFPADDLLDAIQGAARHVNRFVQVIAAGGQAPDHPVHPAIPETRYLKAFFCRVSVE